MGVPWAGPWSGFVSLGPRSIGSLLNTLVPVHEDLVGISVPDVSAGKYRQPRFGGGDGYLSPLGRSLWWCGVLGVLRVFTTSLVV